MAEYDSRPDTWAHIHLVQEGLRKFITNLVWRMFSHDQSKLAAPERETYDRFTPQLGQVPYGSPAYHDILRAMGPALAHHYSENSHHPEHYGTLGIRGMDLIDVVEMVCDWEAAARRTGGHARDSLDIQQQRFGFSDDLKQIILNTLPLLDGSNPHT